MLRKARREGMSLRECAKVVQIDGTGIGRFLRILELPHDLRHLVDWGTGKHFIGFTSAVELARFRDAGDQRAVADAILSNNLNSKEVRQVAQLRERSGRSVDVCLKEVLGMRPVIDKRYVFIGLTSPKNIDGLARITQADRDSVLASGLERLGLRSATGRLGLRFFTLVGDKRFSESMRDIGKENIEARLRVHISEALENAVPDC